MWYQKASISTLTALTISIDLFQKLFFLNFHRIGNLVLQPLLPIRTRGNSTIITRGQLLQAAIILMPQLQGKAKQNIQKG